MVRGRALSFCAHNAGAANKTRSLPGKMFGVKSSCQAAIPGSGEWPGQALQDDTIPQGAGGGGGGWAGSVLVSTNFSVPLFKAFKGKKWHFYYFQLKNPNLATCASEIGIFPWFHSASYRLTCGNLPVNFMSWFPMLFFNSSKSYIYKNKSSSSYVNIQSTQMNNDIRFERANKQNNSCGYKACRKGLWH